MKRMAISLLMCGWAVATGVVAFAQEGNDVPDTAAREILRRGNLVQRVGNGHRDDAQVAISDAMRPPADDSHKWFISVVATRNCRYCDNLKRDFASSEYLKPFVDLEDHAQSWAHFNVYAIEDQTQTWRFKDIKLSAYPTLIIQPPRNGRFGDPKTVVLQKTGYDGDPKKLADAIRTGIGTYLKSYVRQRQAVGHKGGMRQGPDGAGQSVVGYDPPFTPPPKVEPTPYYPAPSPYPFDFPPGPNPAPAPQPNVNPLSLLLSLFGGALTSGGMTNLLLVVIAGLAVVRTFRKATGQKLLLDDATYQAIVDTIKSLVTPPKTPTA